MQFYHPEIKVIPNPIEISNYPFRLRNNPQPIFIWLRAFHHIYNPELAIHVFANLSKIYPKSKMMMVGPDKGDGSLEAAQNVASKLGVKSRIEFTGAVSKSEVPSIINLADIFLNTTNIDNTPVSVIEAMACGSCIVSTNVGGLPYLLENKKDFSC